LRNGWPSGPSTIGPLPALAGAKKLTGASLLGPLLGAPLPPD
jgi:hypothetical protein